MSSDSDKPNPRPSDDQELGAPIVDLLNLEQDISPAFLSSVRKKIYRRVTASQFASFSWGSSKNDFARVLEDACRTFEADGFSEGRTLMREKLLQSFGHLLDSVIAVTPKVKPVIQ